MASATAGVCFAVTPDDCSTLRKHGHRPEAKTCYEVLAQSHDPYMIAEGYWGLEVYDQANNEFRAAVAQSPNNAMYRVRWGRLLHERFNNTDADNLFNEAIKLDPKNAQAYLGLALVSADGFDDKAIEYGLRTIDMDPNFFPGYFYLGLAYQVNGQFAEAAGEVPEQAWSLGWGS